MSNWVSCLVNVVVLFCLAGTGNFCLASTGGSSGGSDQKTVKTIQTHFVTPISLPLGRIFETELSYVAVIRIQYVNGENENDQKYLECGGTIVTQNKVLTDAGCFQDREKKSKTRKDVSDDSDFLKLREIYVVIKQKSTNGQWYVKRVVVSQVDVYRNRNSQKKNQQINIATVKMDSDDLVVKTLPVCFKSTVEKMVEDEQKELLIVGWEEYIYDDNRVHSVGIKVKVKEKSKCKRKHTKRYDGPDTHCAFPRNTQDDMSEDIYTDRGGPVVWDGPDKCLVGVINDGDLSKMGRLNWFMKPININNNIIFTSLEEYAELSAKHELKTIYPNLKK